jgi:CCR4-NOT transcription complex subunit 4
MSDQGEKTCPLCAEEMDFTDQQLKPCKCGYEICVWCWHHLMDMAEKDDTEGKCPACRTPYNKEKIVDKARKCERLMAEVNMERKVKLQKSKSKTSEGRKQLTSVRVIQRNLVYIVGLPLDLADEDLLQQKDYFGQYGKVLKVSISRTAAGAIQHFANNTCSVYITYSKEEDAVRCIQSVHGYMLDGRSLRACFGTTKYCHAWLRSMPCTNPDCLYLHEIGSQEDSYTKDEIISAYTSRAQQITSSAVDMQRRSGSMLPPPADENYNNAPAYVEKPASQSPTNNPPSTLRISPPNSSSGKSAALPAAASWGTRPANGHPPTSLPSPNVPPKQRPESSSGLLSFSMAVATPATLAQDSTSQTDTEKKVNGEIRKSRPKEKSDTMQPLKQYLGTHNSSTSANRTALQKDKDKITIPPQKLDVTAEEKIEKLSADVASVSVSGLKADGPDQFKDIRSNVVEDDLLSSDNRLKDPILATNTNYQNPNGSSLYSNGYTENAHMFLNEEKRRNSTADMGESSIISNILSMDFDSWDEPLSSPQNFAKLLGESDKRQGSFGVSSSWKVQNSNQSRFSFAREDERMVNNSSIYDSNLNMEGGIQNSRYFNNGFVNNGDIYQDKFSNYNGFSSAGADEPDNFLGSHSQFYSNKHSGSRSQISAPPGFSAPNRAPPPGFTSQERVDQPFDAISANHFLDASSTFRKQYQQPQPLQQQPSVHFDTTGDLEFIDPAIMAVGKGRFPGGPHSPSLDTRSSLNFPPQLSNNNFENEARLQLMMQRSLNHRYTDNNDFFSHNNNNIDSSSSYGIPSSRMMAAQNNISQYSQYYLPNPRNGVMANGSWDEWNEVQNGNKYYNRYEEDSKYRMTGSADLYNRTYGI